MDSIRYVTLSIGSSDLTSDETDSGWHWCFDFDGLLVGPGMSELENCCCDYPAVIDARKVWENSVERKQLLSWLERNVGEMPF